MYVLCCIILSLLGLQGVTSNEVTDKILENVRQELMNKGGATDDVIPFSYSTPVMKLFGININVLFKSVEGGKLGDFTTIAEYKGATSEPFGDEIDDSDILIAQITLKDLTLSFDNFLAKLLFMNYYGPAAITCSDNSYTVAVKIDKTDSGECKSTLVQHELGNISGCVLKLESKSFLDKLKLYVFNRFSQLDSAKMQQYFSDDVKTRLEPIIEASDFCRYI